MHWRSTKSRRVLKALEKIGWEYTRSHSSHKVLTKPGFQNFIFCFHDRDEIGPPMLSKISKQTGLSPSDL